jgi:hypothetical protein
LRRTRDCTLQNAAHGEVVYEAVRGLRVEDPAEYVEVGRIRDSLAVPVTLSRSEDCRFLPWILTSFAVS